MRSLELGCNINFNCLRWGGIGITYIYYIVCGLAPIHFVESHFVECRRNGNDWLRETSGLPLKGAPKGVFLRYESFDWLLVKFDEIRRNGIRRNETLPCGLLYVSR